MAAADAAPEPVVIQFPAEFDIGNAGAVAERLRSVITPGTGTVVADLSTTAFVDSSGVRILVLAREWAATDGTDLRLAVPPGPTLLVLQLVGLEQLFRIYPSLEEALAGEPAPDRDA